MGRFIDMTGVVHHKLTVLSLDRIVKGKGAYWLCQCECGKQKVIQGVQLRDLKNRRGSTSCGCGRYRATRTPNLDIIERGYKVGRDAVYGRTKREAGNRGKVFELTPDQLEEIVVKDCTYCGAKPNQYTSPSKYAPPFIHHGIDRVDNEIGYVEGNCVPCCSTCNQWKSKKTVQEFFDHVKSLYEHLELRYKENTFQSPSLKPSIQTKTPFLSSDYIIKEGYVKDWAEPRTSMKDRVKRMNKSRRKRKLKSNGMDSS